MWRQRWSKVWKEKSGITLVELIVAFALIGLFMTAASFVLTSSLRLFTRMQSVSSAVTVSDILLDKIAGEISAAKQPHMQGDVASDHGGYYIWLGKDGNMDFGSGSEWITMWNRSKSPLAIYAEPDGALCLRYYETVRGEVGAAITGASKTVPEMNWHFDNGVYMGYRITEGGLTFSREDPENHPNVIRIDLEIHNDRTGFTYRSSRYAECYNYNYKLEQVKKYLGVRPDKYGMPEDTPPVEAEHFVIKNDEIGGGGGTEEPTIPYGVICYYGNQVIYQNDNVGLAYPNEKKYLKPDEIPDIDGYIFNEDDSYDYLLGITIREEIMTEKDNRFALYYNRAEESAVGFTIYYKSAYTGKEIREKRVISANYGDKITFEAVDIDGYNLNGQWWVETEYTKDNYEYVFYYEPFVNNYRIVFYRTGGEDLAVLQGSIRTDETVILDVPYDKLYGYKVEEKNYNGVILKDGKCQLTAGGWGDSKRYEVRIPCDPVDVPYTIYYKCGDILLAKDTLASGKYGDTIWLSPKTFSGYSPKVWSASLKLDHVEGCQYTFEYTMNEGGNDAPFHPAGSNIEIEIEAKTEREPTNLENQIAQDIFRFFNEGWNKIEIWGEKYLTGAYKIFELDGEKYAVAGGTNREDFEKTLQEKLVGQEGIDKDNIIEIKEDDISNEKDRRIFLEYILKNAGASEEYINGIHSIDIEFDEDDNPKRLEKVSFKNEDGEEIKIKYKK